MRNLARRNFAIAFLAFCFAPAALGGTILFLGDSISAGLGVQPEQAFPALIEQKIHRANLPFEVVNAGLSGDTSAGGLRRVDWLLQKTVDVLVLELGANDGLRGLPVAAMELNLQGIIDRVKAKNPQVKIVIAGMQIPPNLGADYTAAFRAAFADLAQKNHAALIPFLLEGVGGHVEFTQRDQIHPTPDGHKIVAENVWRVLEPLLRKSDS
jgi:acyl-CoA thioesterase-1